MRSRFRKRLCAALREYPIRSIFMIVVGLMCFNICFHGMAFSFSSLYGTQTGGRVTASTNVTGPPALRWDEDNSTVFLRHVPTNYSIYEEPSDNLQYCSLKPKGLVGPLRTKPQELSWERLGEVQANVVGGLWRPDDCRAPDSVAIIVPYRNRDKHLRILLYHLHPMLQRQKLDYGIFVVEQAPGSRFNRASLFNIGFLEALKVHNFSCFIFHDVDLLPEDDRNIYRCGANPRHMSAAVDKFKYRLPYNDIFGGVSALSKDQFLHVNGFSNLYFGWGGEDDDMSGRIRRHGMKIMRYPFSIARYKMIRHKSELGNNANPLRHRLIAEGAKRAAKDGVRNVEYNLESALPHGPVFWVRVSIMESRVLQRWRTTALRSLRNGDAVGAVVAVYIILGFLAFVLFTAWLCHRFLK